MKLAIGHAGFARSCRARVVMWTVLCLLCGCASEDLQGDPPPSPPPLSTLLTYVSRAHLGARMIVPLLPHATISGVARATVPAVQGELLGAVGHYCSPLLPFASPQFLLARTAIHPLATHPVHPLTRPGCIHVRLRPAISDGRLTVLDPCRRLCRR